MVIITDDQIPHIQDILSRFGEVRPVNGRAIHSRDLVDARALVVRTVTRVDLNLLENTPIKFVGTATSGVDHIDIAALLDSGITVADAAGCNAPAVCDYVLTALFEQAVKMDKNLFESTIGIVGVGHVGDELRGRLQALGIKTLLNDPPRSDLGADAPGGCAFVQLADLLAECDVVSLHVPLTHDGPYPTAGLIGSQQLGAMIDDAWLVNTCRGGVVDEQALVDCLESGRLRAFIDVWADEPTPDCRLVKQASVATPHIAGYGFESKRRATEAIGVALAKWAGESHLTDDSPSLRVLPIAAPGPDLSDTEFCASIIQQAYDIRRDHLHMQGMCSFESSKRAEFFGELRSGYRLRNEFSSHYVDGSRQSDHRKQLALGLGFRVA